MPRRCALTGKAVQHGNNVAHSNKKTNRQFLPNLQNVSLYSSALQRSVPLRISVRALRSVQKNGGLDAYLMGRADANLPAEALRLKRSIHHRLSGGGSVVSDSADRQR